MDDPMKVDLTMAQEVLLTLHVARPGTCIVKIAVASKTFRASSPALTRRGMPGIVI